MYSDMFVSFSFKWKSFRTRYKEAQDQLVKGRKFYEEVLVPMAGVPESWQYLGLVCFPEVESRELFANIVEENEIKVGVHCPSSFSKYHKKILLFG